MIEVLSALRPLGLKWAMLSPYCVQARWRQSAATSDMELDGQEYEVTSTKDRVVTLNLQLYKVQQGIYLLDFQMVEGEVFMFITLCSRFINQLKLRPARLKLAAAEEQHAQYRAQLTKLRGLAEGI